MPNVRTVNIKGKKYVDVAERVRLVHEERESFEIIESGLLSVGGSPLQIGDMWVWQVAILVNGKRYMGTAEIKLNAPRNTADGTNPFACAETSAVGRALGFANLGALESICSADEVYRAQSEQEAYTDRPQVRKITGSEEKGSITDAQKAAITRLMKEVPANLTEWSQQKASEMIRDLQSRQKAS